MALSVVVFDVGETLVDEAAAYERWDAASATTLTHVFVDRDLHTDALPCLAALRARGLRLGAAGNMHARHEEFLRPHVDFVGSSERWGVEKPEAGFFVHVVEEAGAPADEILYVGDRVDNDVVPAVAAGLKSVRVRRGAHAKVPSPDGTVTIDSLAELPEALARV
jgi:HAD superfamily hydrolase (TIGR01549 family)